MMATPVIEPRLRAEWLADPELRGALDRFVRRRLRGEDASDVVQATIADVLANDGAPDDEEGFRRFVFIVARNKLVDHIRRHTREVASDELSDHALAGHDPVSARDLLRWAEEELPNSDDKHTLEWMLREADGDKLEHIAEEAKVPAPRVRQRVSRLRRYLKERWAAQLAAAGMAGIVLLLGYAYYDRQETIGEHIRKQPRPEQLQPEQELRRYALDRCHRKDWTGCLEGLDRAKVLDPEGDAKPNVQEARAAAARALAPPPTPTPDQAPMPVPSGSVPQSIDSMPSKMLAPPPTAKAPAPKPNPKYTSSDFAQNNTLPALPAPESAKPEPQQRAAPKKAATPVPDFEKFQNAK